MSYTEYKNLNLTQIGDDIRRYWEENNTFEEGQRLAEGHPAYVFYDGPPSANGKPGIHHVMARTIKDVFCRYKAQKGFFVDRKAGWDTHGLPVELGVEKNLGITKEDIGKKISVDDYNRACREEVMKYKELWDELTRVMGYWVDLKNPYITFDNDYIETLWFLLKKLYDKGLLYKGYTIQPYSPAAGTGLSSHELNMPGCYRDVKDTTCVAMFRITSDLSDWSNKSDIPTYAIAWTTTPWTLPSNTALCVGPNIDYVLLETTHPYMGEPCRIIMAEARLGDFFTEGETDEKSKLLPCKVLHLCKGKDLEGLRYEQLIPWVKPTETDSSNQGSFRIILGDYVTTEDGTGIVHIAPTFGADDARVAKKAGIGDLLLFDRDGKQMPMVDKQGRFARIEDLDPAWVKENVDVEEYGKYAGKFVKNAYDPAKSDKDMSLDVELVIMLKEQGKLFKSEKHTHSYPHCWRTDKPVLYYPLDSWFIRTTALKERMIELNKTINWKPEATGTGRFGNWLENIVDWNLSRSRYWGTPLPIWRTEDGKEEKCIGSVKELSAEIGKAVAAGLMTQEQVEKLGYNQQSTINNQQSTHFDLHRPYIDNVVLVSDSGKPMRREPDLIDVWFDSGAMPYAQIHYMGEPLKATEFPADFIAEGVDQTRGWFYTLHAIATMCFDSVAFKNVISNGLVLDKNGNKMSKRLGNAVDPFDTLAKYGPDATRWYMITNSQPWDNLKFDVEGVDEVRRKFFGTLYNTYSFFALYANLDGFDYSQPDLPADRRPEIDRWILSELNTLVQTVDAAFADYEPTRAGRAIAEFVDACLSNWYVRLSRRRFWRGDMTDDKLSAYQTLYTCLETLARIMAPIAPFFAERLFLDLNAVTRRFAVSSVHHADFPTVDTALIDHDLEDRMRLAQRVSSLTLALRKKHNLRVRQPLQRIVLPAANDRFRAQVEAVQSLILSEVNVKELQFLAPDDEMLVKRIKANFKTLGPRYGKIMKALSAAIAGFSQQQINALQTDGHYSLTVEGQPVELTLEDVEIATQDIPGWVVANEGALTVALDITLTDDLRNEGIAREFVNRVQNIRKEQFDVTDRISITLTASSSDAAIRAFQDYICAETLCTSLTVLPAGTALDDPQAQEIELVEKETLKLLIKKN